LKDKETKLDKKISKLIISQ